MMLMVKHFRTNNRKWTENKFKAKEAKPELLDDWDQRLVITTLENNDQGSRITLNQVAEKDQVSILSFSNILSNSFQWHCKDSTVVYEVDPEDKDILIMTCMTEDVMAWRKFQRVVASSGGTPNRKISAPF